MINQPIMYVGNATRLEEYQVSTCAYKVDDEITYRKIARTIEAQGHLKTICNNYDLLRGFLSNSKVQVVQPTNVDLENGSVDFAEIKGTSLLEQLFDALDSQQDDLVNDLITTYIAFLELFIVEAKSGMNEFVGGFVESESDRTKECLAIVDASFSNIIISDDSEWTVIDYEWILDFTIPLDILLARSIIYFCISYEESLRFSSNRIPSIEFGSFPLPNLFLKYCDIETLIHAWDFERSFQTFVQGVEPHMPELNTDGKTVGVPQDGYLAPEDELDRLNKENHRLLFEVESKDLKLNEAIKRVTDIENSKTWKLGIKIGQIVTKFFQDLSELNNLNQFISKPILLLGDSERTARKLKFTNRT